MNSFVSWRGGISHVVPLLELTGQTLDDPVPNAFTAKWFVMPFFPGVVSFCQQWWDINLYFSRLHKSGFQNLRTSKMCSYKSFIRKSNAQKNSNWELRNPNIERNSDFTIRNLRIFVFLDKSGFFTINNFCHSSNANRSRETFRFGTITIEIFPVRLGGSNRPWSTHAHFFYKQGMAAMVV